MVLSGHGPVFNPGERVEAATSTLWLWLLVVGDVVLPLRLEYIAVLEDVVLRLTRFRHRDPERRRRRNDPRDSRRAVDIDGH